MITFVASTGTGSRWKLCQVPGAVRAYEGGAKNIHAAIGQYITSNGLLRANEETYHQK